MEIEVLLGLALHALDHARLDVPVVAEHNVPVGVHAHHGRFGAQLDHRAALVEADTQLHIKKGRCPNLRAVVDRLDAPHSAAAVVQRHLATVGHAVPDANRAVLAACDDHRQLRVEENARDVLRVALERLDARLRLVIPDADRLWVRLEKQKNLVVRSRHQIGLVAGNGVVDAIHAHFVFVEREEGGGGVQSPHLDRVVQSARRERVTVLGIESDLHHVMRVAFVGLRVNGIAKSYSHQLPVLLPVPQLDCHVVTAGEDQRLRRMDVDAANIVGVGIELGHLGSTGRREVHFLRCVVVVDSDFEIIAANDDPLLSLHESAGRGIPLTDHVPCVVIPYVHLSREEGSQDPRLCRVHVDALHSVGVVHEQFLKMGRESQTDT